MPQAGVLTADCFFGKAMTIEGLAKWARSRIEQIEQAKDELRHDWRGLCLLRALIYIIWWSFLRPLRRAGIKAFEPIELGCISATLDEINSNLGELLLSAHSRGYDTRCLLRGSFRSLKSYRVELERFAAMVRQASAEWDEAVFQCGSEAIDQLRAISLRQTIDYPPDFAEQNLIESSLNKSELRDHLGRVVLRS